jgi:hypothetical protein
MMLETFLMVLCGFITLFMFFYKLIILPLSEAITELKVMLAEIREEIKLENEKRSRIEIRVSVLEEKIYHLEHI